MVSGVVFGGFFVRKKIFWLWSWDLYPFPVGFYGHAFKPPMDDSTYFFQRE